MKTIRKCSIPSQYLIARNRWPELFRRINAKIIIIVHSLNGECIQGVMIIGHVFVPPCFVLSNNSFKSFAGLSDKKYPEKYLHRLFWKFVDTKAPLTSPSTSEETVYRSCSTVTSSNFASTTSRSTICTIKVSLRN